MQIQKCGSCGAGPKFIRATKEPLTSREFYYCGRCRRVQGSAIAGVPEPVEAVKNLQMFAINTVKVLMQASGVEVLASSFTEGVKTGVQMCLGVPSSERELYWMEKYGVAKGELIKEVQCKIDELQSLVKVAGTDKE